MKLPKYTPPLMPNVIKESGMNYIHHTAVIGPNVELGEGNYIGPFCIIGMPAEHKTFWPDRNCCGGLDEAQFGKVIIGNNNVFTGHVTIDAGTETDTVIGDNCFLMKSVHCGHDTQIGNDVTISCGAKIGGHTVVGNYSNIGLNAVVHQKQTIAEGVMIGMGAVVTKKLATEPYKTYAGNPAKMIGENLKHPNYEQYTINQKEYL
jgi:UDP-N-acetylglucosamine acyltransferase